MLTSRNHRNREGQKLSVEVAYPRRYVVSKLVRGLTLKTTLLGAALGFAHGAWQHSSGERPERGNAAMLALAGETLAGAAIGASAGLVGGFAYAFVGGAPGALAGIAGATLAAGGTVAALPTFAAIPGWSNLGNGARSALGYVEPSSTNAETVAFVDDTIAEDAPPPAPKFSGPWNDRVVFLGMNPGPTARATGSLKRNADAEVIGIMPSLSAPRARVGNRTFNLSQTAGINGFVDTLKLPAKQAAGVRRAFAVCERGARDELAGLAQIWARGEKGERIPSRLIMAGHSNGDGVWGDDNGSLRLGPLLRLSRALPRATAQIEDAFVTGCYSGGEVTIEQYRLIFPRAKTLWTYDTQAPGVDNGATVDQSVWEKATRGRRVDFLPSSSAVSNKKMAVWNSQTGYHGHEPPLTTPKLRGRVQWMEEKFFQPAMKGEDETFDGYYHIPLRITDPQTGLVRQYYSWLVRLTQRKDLPEDERAYWIEKKHQTIRLIYYSATVAPRFANTHQAQVQKGFRELGLNAPDFRRASRKEALDAIERYLSALERNPNPGATAQSVGNLLERGLQDLDPQVIPDGWV